MKSISGVAAGDGRLRSPKISEVIARKLVSDIIESGLAPGTKLPTEKAMIESLNVGRTTLREALRLLETRGVITIRSGPRGGPVVRRPHPSDLGEALTLILQFEGATLSHVMEARKAFEPMVARLAASRITGQQLDALETTVGAMLENLEDHAVFVVQSRLFHSVIAEASGNVVLRVFNESLKSIADGLIAGVRYTKQNRRVVAEAHMRVVEALRSRDEDDAEKTLQAHLDEGARYWNRRFGQLMTHPVQWVH